MRSIHKKGLTLFEVVVASSILSILAALGLSAFIDVMQMVNNQDANTRMDQRANAALREMTKLLKPAILPTAGEGGKNSAFEDIDNVTYGFGGSNGTAWRTSLREGMDEIAFVVPIDAQEVGDFLDGRGHLQIGQVRGGIAYLGARPYGTPNSGASFFIRNGDDELVNALADIRPDSLGSWPFASKTIPSDSDWQSLYGSRVGTNSPVTAFMVIRFIPAMDNSGNPIVVAENGVLRDGITTYNIDLDGDGENNGTFHIGQLQVLYSGGGNFYHVAGSGTVMGPNAVQPMVVPLTSFTVLRRAAENDRTPIFRLMNYSDDFIETSGDNAGMIIPGTGGSGSSGRLALNIKFLMVENEDLATGRPMTKLLVNHLRPRWYETTVVLKNMER